MKFLKKVGIMQGRLSPQYLNLIQCFPEKYWHKEFRIANKLGLKFIEWTLDYKKLFENPLFDKNKISKIRYLKKKYNIGIKSLTADCLMEKPFWKLKDKKFLEMFIKIISACSNLGIKYLIVPLVDNGSLSKKKFEKNLIKILKDNNEFLIKKKVIILFESDLNPAKLKILIKKFPRGNFGINYDTGNSASLGYDIEKEFKAYGKYIKNIHIKDRLYKGKTVRLGSGNADFEKLKKLLIKINYNNNIILQTARGKKNKDIEEIKINLNFFKKKMI
jgi:L-ribulose-5-phosphate 3-epimerase